VFIYLCLSVCLCVIVLYCIETQWNYSSWQSVFVFDCNRGRRIQRRKNQLYTFVSNIFSFFIINFSFLFH
jgi:hypothetical protein